MTHRAALAAIAAAIAFASPAISRADSLPLLVGVGGFIPTSTSSTASNPGFAVQSKQTGNIGLELTLQPHVFSSSFQISALYLSQRETDTFGPFSSSFSISQYPVMLEESSGVLGPVRVGGGLGYDFVNGAGSSDNGIAADTFVQIGLGSGTSIEAKYLFGRASALSGVFAGVSVRI